MRHPDDGMIIAPPVPSARTVRAEAMSVPAIAGWLLVGLVLSPFMLLGWVAKKMNVHPLDLAFELLKCLVK